MGAEVYVDLYFLINFSMDFFCLLIAGKLLHRRTSAWRLLLGGAAGGIYAVAVLLLGISGADGLICDLAAAVAICTLAFCAKGIGLRRILHTSLIFALVSMVVGGVMTALYSLLNRLDLPFEALQGDNLSVWLFGLLAIAGGFAAAKGGRLMGLSDKTKSVAVEAVLFEKKIVLRAMVDSGNLLRDPVSGRSVIVAEREKMRTVLPFSLPRDAKNDERTALSFLKAHPEAASRLRLIPAKTATGEGLLPAIVPDSLMLCDGKERYTADYLIAVSSLGSSAQGFDAVIAPF